MNTTATPKVARDRKDAGFTLIELMVVVLVIGILLAIAVPTFLGARNRANDSAARSSLRNALVSANIVATDSGNGYWNVGGVTTAAALVGSTSAGLTQAEPALTFTNSVAGTNVANNGRTIDVGLVPTNSLATVTYTLSGAPVTVTPAQLVGALVLVSQSAANSCHVLIATTQGGVHRLAYPGTAAPANCNAATLTATTLLGVTTATPVAWTSWPTW